MRQYYYQFAFDGVIASTTRERVKSGDAKNSLRDSREVEESNVYLF